jgi:hypothetical protein
MFLVILTVGYAMSLGGYFVISDIEVRAQGLTVARERHIETGAKRLNP